MSVSACTKITMGCSGQDADDSAGSAIGTGVWVVWQGVRGPGTAVLWAKLPLLVANKASPPCGKQDEHQSSTSSLAPLLFSACPCWLCSVFGCCRAPTRAKLPLPASPGLSQPGLELWLEWEWEHSEYPTGIQPQV